MQTNGADQQRGHVLLIAGDVAGRRRTVQVEPSANLAALAVVPIPVLLGSSVPSDTTYLDGIRGQNALLMRLRTAAATPGPLLVYLSGRLTADRRQQLHLALSGTTTSTTRYTALPWEWLGAELRTRPAGLTTILLDLAADKHAWPLLQEHGMLPGTASAETYGVIAPPGFPGSHGVSTYTRHLIEQLRLNPDRPASSRLHALTVGAAALPPGTVIVPAAPEITAPVPRPPVSNLQRLLAGDTSLLQRLPGRRQPEPEPEPQRRADEIPWDEAVTFELPPTAHQRVPDVDRTVQAEHRPALVPQQAPPRQAPQQQVPAQPSPPAATPAPQPAPASAYQYPAPVPVAQPAPVAQPPAPPVQPDPRPHIHELAVAGRFGEAAQLALAWEQYTLQTYGIDSPQATQWTEIRADLAKMEGKWLLATQLWVAAGRTRLAHQAPDAAEVLAAATSAHYCWAQIPAPRDAIACAPELISLLRALPSLDRRHVSAAQERLQYLHAAPGGR